MECVRALKYQLKTNHYILVRVELVTAINIENKNGRKRELIANENDKTSNNQQPKKKTQNWEVKPASIILNLIFHSHTILSKTHTNAQARTKKINVKLLDSIQ